MPVPPPSSDLSVPEILRAFASARERRLPVAALRAADQQREALIPHLEQAIDVALALSAAGRLQAEGDWRMPSFAWHLLACWRVPGAYERLMRVLTLPDIYDQRWLLAEAYAFWPNLLVTCFDGDLERVQRCAVDRSLTLDVRTCFLRVHAAMVHLGAGDRETVAAWYESLIRRPQRPGADWLELSRVLISAVALKFTHLWPLMQQALRAHKVKKLDFSLEEMAEEVERLGTPLSENPRDSLPPAPVRDVIAFIGEWDYFRPLPPGVEADLNDPLNKSLLAYFEAAQPKDAPGSRPGPFILPERHVRCPYCESGLPYGQCCVNGHG